MVGMGNQTWGGTCKVISEGWHLQVASAGDIGQVIGDTISPIFKHFSLCQVEQGIALAQSGSPTEHCQLENLTWQSPVQPGYRWGIFPHNKEDSISEWVLNTDGFFW